MNQVSQVLSQSDDLPVRTSGPVHSGKVRSVYFLEQADSRRLIEERNYPIHADSQLALMVISDRISAFDCAWRSRSMSGVPGKGTALNAISAHWFGHLSDSSGFRNHLLEMPHPMLWVVQRAQPVMLEAIARRYLTGSLWRAYERGTRDLAGADLPDGLQRFGRFDEVLFTPSTKGIITGISGVPEHDDAPVSPEIIEQHPQVFALRHAADLARIRDPLIAGFKLIEEQLQASGRLLVDTKFEFGYAPSLGGEPELIYMDEIATPDSSRIWMESDWRAGAPRELSKEFFREALMRQLSDADVLLDASRMEERKAVAAATPLPDELFDQVSQLYRDEAKAVTGRESPIPERPREEISEVLSSELKLL